MGLPVTVPMEESPFSGRSHEAILSECEVRGENTGVHLPPGGNRRQ